MEVIFSLWFFIFGKREESWGRRDKRREELKRFLEGNGGI